MRSFGLAFGFTAPRESNHTMIIHADDITIGASFHEQNQIILAGTRKLSELNYFSLKWLGTTCEYNTCNLSLVFAVANTVSSIFRCQTINWPLNMISCLILYQRLVELFWHYINYHYLHYWIVVSCSIQVSDKTCSTCQDKLHFMFSIRN